ncbi:putative atp-dependent rna helicase suv3 protein [Phaeoacremonium minimum UCRPA7]|uniref:Putative atp-dependent rna helicase suv3 protein n=1 Tax=Phaeoacremonium minimum (strain UCR-PA7) TaxID=1286976 RepID=R8BBE8_PHAM7|nr:putative atp-dependent rna helicase suv3 protein [Phaeoacremonium minimum UCRPA7]EON96612.1 putative atp-dependent rna helicase suv3 protein [Phaeoacremonium minimum UCRPA7]
MRESLQGDFRNLRKGDAVVAFSRVGLHSLKAGIEKATGRRCAIVYGSLPPETRAQQAALFNDPDNDYDYLAASDAIGMGLNLEIKRVVFETATKHDGMQYRTLHIPEVKQIGGRAGRYRTATQDMKASAGTSPPAGSPAAVKWGTAGFVTTMEDEDLKVIQRSFSTDAEPLKTAGILPPTRIIERFSSYFPPQTPLSFMLLRLKELAKISSKFHFCRSDDMIEVADIIQPYPMSISDRCIFLSAPVTLRDFGQKEVLKAFAKCVSDMSGGHLLDIEEINLEVLDADRDTFPGGSSLYLRHLEALHKSITLYLWLSYRYLGIFESQHLAFHVKGLVEEKINDYLEHLNFVPEARLQHARRARQMAEQRRVKQEKVFHGETPSDDLPHHEGPGNWQEEGHEEPLLEDPEEAQTVTPSSERTSGIISTDSNQDQTRAGAQV